MVPFNLAVGLRVEGRGGNVPYTQESQVFIELLGDIAYSIIRKWHIDHPGKVYRRLDHLSKQCGHAIYIALGEK